MFKLKQVAFLFFFFTFSVYGQDSLNMEKLYQYDDNSFSPVSGVYFNDCWGYTDDAGNEYAIMGGARHVFFFDITDPVNTTLVRKVFDGDDDISGGVDLDPTVWRDFKTYGDKAYSVADQSSSDEGLIVYDLSDLPDTVLVEDQITTFFTKAHNIFIDTASGYLYTAGARLGSTYHDVIVLDLNEDPIEMIADVSIDGGYIHDIHVVNDTAYCNSGGSSDLYIIDFTDPENPETIGSLDSYTGSGYNHSGWLTEDGEHYVFCDETQGRKVKIMDVTDPANISNADITDQFFSNLVNESATNPGSLAHNPFIVGDLCYVAYYDDGVQVFDISDPNNVVKDSYYDTNNNTNYSANDGVWGVYPFFDSGTIIASDILNGLYVLERVDAPLLVELLEFNAVKDQSNVSLTWATASERNSAFFDVERSVDGLNFSPIGKVDAHQNSTNRIDYEMLDEAPLAGINYYRLKQVDLDGTFQYSDIKSVKFQENVVTIAPTLLSIGQPINLILDQPIDELTIDILATNGQHIKTHQFNNADQGTTAISTIGMQNGLYILRIQYDETTFSQKVMIAK